MPCRPCLNSKYGLVSVVTSSTRPTGADLYKGKQIYETDTDRELTYDGTGWVIMSEPAQSWTPVITNFTIGTGGSAGATGYYKRSDGFIDISSVSTLGTSGASVGTTLTLTLPIAAHSLRRGQLTVAFGDTGGFVYPAINELGTTSCVLYAHNASGTYSNNNGNVTSTVPFTWAAGDDVQISGRYRMTTRYS